MGKQETTPPVNLNAKTNSLLIAVTLLSSYLAVIVDAVFPIGTPIVFLSVVILIAGLYNNRLRFNINFVVLTLTVISIILISCLIHGYNSAILPTVLFYLVFGVALTYAAAFSFRYDDLVKYIYYIFVGSSLFLMYGGYFGALGVHETMGISYGMLPGIFMVAHMKEIYNFTHKKIWFFLSIVPFAASVFLFFSFSVRGTILAFFLYIIFRTYKNIKYLYFRLIYIIATTALSILVYLNLAWIFIQLQSIFQTLNINILFINKTIRLINQETILNSRELYYELFLFRFNPLLGQGIGDFFSTTGYMHNLFLQAIDELGLFYVIPFIFFIGYAVKELFLMKKNEEDYYNILALFFFLAVPRLMVSDFYWRTVAFWLLIVYIISRRNEPGKTSPEINSFSPSYNKD